MKKQKGFSLIELLIVVAIMGILSAVVLSSLGTAREKARDARRLGDVKDMANLLVIESDTGNVPLTGCTGDLVDTSTCTGPGNISYFKTDYSDPGNGTASCTNASTDVCNYSIGRDDGEAGGGTEKWQICFYLEYGSGDLSAGLNSIVGPIGTLVSGCK